ncbi:hypothetical protein [Mucilaginibacter ginsenosidivorax]|uniref:Uncharacterized protein n=1 Tax=Mucilaginibacter ginsenosidivorax TaxID=862126 RepID=A0A5B8VUX4_9SPHI|nr:hypothetical protein [Mucilaginibacter ginsenosidivorax]QEC75464.1 hypothetical protein FSB76_05705 [Mucilaginibacter ginsenosidivorax]
MNKPLIPCYCEEQSICGQHTTSLHSVRLPQYATHDMLDSDTNTGFERRLILTRQGYARHPLSGFAVKRGLKFNYFSFFNTALSTVQAPLSTAGEERVAGAASPGESSPRCNLRHPYFKSSRNANTRNNLGANTIYPI